jgi:hypothetical protein
LFTSSGLDRAQEELNSNNMIIPMNNKHLRIISAPW